MMETKMTKWEWDGMKWVDEGDDADSETDGEWKVNDSGQNAQQSIKCSQWNGASFIHYNGI